MIKKKMPEKSISQAGGKMDLSLLYWEFSGFLFISIAGFLSHFIFVWSGRNRLVGVFGAVNESVWEHQKLVFWPSVIFALTGSFFLAGAYDFWFAKAVSIVFMPLFIICVHYAYKTLLGKRIIFVDISLFFIAAALGQFLSFRLMTAATVAEHMNNIGIIVISFVSLLFITFTFYPIHIHIFRDATNGRYGMDI